MNYYIEFFQKIPVLILLLLSATSVISGDYFAKFWSINGKTTYLLLAFLAYFFSGFFYIPTLLREGLVTTSVVWSLLSIVGFVVIGIVFFKESLTVAQAVGALIGIVALIILSYSLK